MKIVTRKEWGARPALGSEPLVVAELRGTAIHYSAMDADEQADHRNCPGRVRNVQDYHLDTKGWLDGAYSYLVCVHGYAFEMRGWGVRTAANGTNEANDAYHAICFLGNDDEGRQDVTPAAREAIAALIASGQAHYPRATEVRPHSDFKQTGCPGDELRAWIAADGWKAQEPALIPAWWKWWARWRLGGRKWRRPGSAPKRIPLWAWKRLERFIREGRKP